MDHVEHIHRRELLRRAAVLLGAGLSAPAVLGILNGCSARPSSGAPNGAPSSRTLGAHELELVSEIADIMIPRTDTPGARDVGVPGFIDTMLTDVYPERDRARFVSGLDGFAADVRRATRRDFLDLPAAERLQQVQRAHDAALAAAPREGERPFILMTRELTLLGYFTSEVGATQVLQYEAIPGAYHGCQPLAQAGIGRTWATEHSLPF